MTQIERIAHMERILDDASEAAQNLSIALERYLAMRDNMALI